MDISKIEFDSFIVWLKGDGLYPKKSERLWRKTIFANLLHDDPKTVDNFLDFKQEQIIKILLSSNIRYNDINSTISNVELLDSEFSITTLDLHHIQIKCTEIDKFLKNCCFKD